MARMVGHGDCVLHMPHPRHVESSWPASANKHLPTPAGTGIFACWVHGRAPILRPSSQPSGRSSPSVHGPVHPSVHPSIHGHPCHPSSPSARLPDGTTIRATKRRQRTETTRHSSARERACDRGGGRQASGWAWPRCSRDRPASGSRQTWAPDTERVLVVTLAVLLGGSAAALPC